MHVEGNWVMLGHLHHCDVRKILCKKAQRSDL